MLLFFHPLAPLTRTFSAQTSIKYMIINDTVLYVWVTLPFFVHFLHYILRQVWRIHLYLILSDTVCLGAWGEQGSGHCCEQVLLDPGPCSTHAFKDSRRATAVNHCQEDGWDHTGYSRKTLATETGRYGHSTSRQRGRGSFVNCVLIPMDRSPWC